MSFSRVPCTSQGTSLPAFKVIQLDNIIYAHIMQPLFTCFIHIEHYSLIGFRVGPRGRRAEGAVRAEEAAGKKCTARLPKKTSENVVVVLWNGTHGLCMSALSFPAGLKRMPP